MSARPPKPEWLKRPYNNSEESHKLFTYVDKDRKQPLALETLDYATVGTLMETYVDALHLSLVMSEPAVERKLREKPQDIRDPSFFGNERYLPPKFIREAIGDYRAATSFFRGDMAMQGQGPWMQGKQPKSAAFAQAVHIQLRYVANDYGAHFTLGFFPPKGTGENIPQALWKNFKYADAALHAFKQLQKEYGEMLKKVASEYRKKQASKEADEGEKQSARVTSAQTRKHIFSAFLESPEFDHKENEIREAIEEIIYALSPIGQRGQAGINRFYLEYKGAKAVIDNKRLNKDFSLSYPSLMMVSLGSKGKHDIDQMVASKEIFTMFTQVIGVESQITENLQKLHTTIIKPALGEQGDDLLYNSQHKQQFLEAITSHIRGIQLLYSFHKTAGQLEKIYPEGKGDIAYLDMERMLTLAGVKEHWVDTLDDPKEAACLIYALGRRLSLDKNHGFKGVTEGNKLSALANKIGKYSHFAKIPAKEKNEIEEAIAQFKEEWGTSRFGEVAHALDLLEESLSKMTQEQIVKEHEKKGRER